MIDNRGRTQCVASLHCFGLHGHGTPCPYNITNEELNQHIILFVAITANGGNGL